MTYTKQTRSDEKPAADVKNLYEQIGGAEAIDRLVHAFYPKVYAHPVLSPLFTDSMEEIRSKQYLFLTQFIGGPSLYTDRYGFGNMRLIHDRFPITPDHAEAWLSCMREAMDETDLQGFPRQMMLQMLTNASKRFVNTGERAE